MRKSESKPGKRSNANRAQGVENRKNPDTLKLTKVHLLRKACVRFDGRDGPSEYIVKGRDLWALHELEKAGAGGVTSINCPGPRWSAYIYNLRVLGLDIETVRERHGGEYPGTHARYVLHTPVSVIEIDDCDGPVS